MSKLICAVISKTEGILNKLRLLETIDLISKDSIHIFLNHLYMLISSQL